MVIGQGLLATSFSESFANSRDMIIFASGVSNSQEQHDAAFMRERHLLEACVQHDKKLIYFSTCSLYDPELANSPYVHHKRAMEALVQQSSRFCIFRLPQVVGRTTNTKTLTNFLYTKIMAGEHLDIWRHAKRNLIDVTDVVLLVKYLLNDNAIDQQTIDIACPISITMFDLMKIFERVLAKNAHYSLIEAGGAYRIDTTLTLRVAKQVGIHFDDAYIERVVNKYYGQ